MIHLQIAITALILGLLSWLGVNVFDEAGWENTATMCAAIMTICGLLFIISIIAWLWSW